MKYAVGRFFLIFLVAGSLAGCSLGRTSFQSPEVRSSERKTAPRVGDTVGSSAPLPPPVEERSAVEILWEVPTEPVDGFILRYGEAHEALSAERRLSIGEIDKIEDRERGKLYRYVIPDVANSQRIFLSISAFKGNTESLPSRVFEVAPGAPE